MKAPSRSLFLGPDQSVTPHKSLRAVKVMDVSHPKPAAVEKTSFQTYNIEGKLLDVNFTVYSNDSSYPPRGGIFATSRPALTSSSPPKIITTHENGANCAGQLIKLSQIATVSRAPLGTAPVALPPNPLLESVDLFAYRRPYLREDLITPGIFTFITALTR